MIGFELRQKHDYSKRTNLPWFNFNEEFHPGSSSPLRNKKKIDMSSTSQDDSAPSLLSYARIRSRKGFLMSSPTAIIGDIHGCIGELKELVRLLRAEGVETIYHLGDLVDRGPDSVGVVRFCREQGIRGIMGNHENSLLRMIDKMNRPGVDMKSLEGDERRTYVQKLSAEDLAYIRTLPKLHALDEYNVVLVHGGLFPGRSLYQQDVSVLFMQVIHPDRPGDIRWRNKPGKYTLEQSRAEGFAPWQELYDGDEIAVYGHTVFAEPSVLHNSIGIDTGCVFGGKLTALVLPEKRFVSIPAKKKYAERDFIYEP